jgi:hypothetical protein
VEWEVIDPVVNGTKGVDVLIWKAGSSSTFVELYDWTFNGTDFTHLNGTNEATYDFNTSDQATNPSNANSHISWCYDMELTILDAKINIEPDATNEVGQPHNFTVTVMEDTGDGNEFVAAVGETVNVFFNGIFGANDPADTSCVTNSTGQCDVTVNSNTAGQIIASASSDVNVNGTIIPKSTDGVSPNSGNATKTYVDAKIQIDPDATNEIGDPHDFTITLMKDAGDGNGFVAAQSEKVNVSFANVFGAEAQSPSMCTTDSSGQCDVTVNSTTTGKIIANASSTVLIDGVSVTRSTDGVSPNSGNATKTYVDAKISIGPNATNIVGDPHNFTINVMKDIGDGNGFVAANNTDVTVDFVSVNATVQSPNPAMCTTDSSGQCIVTVNSTSAGTIKATASATVEIDEASLSRTTDGSGNNSYPAVKTYIEIGAKINITPDATNEVGDPHNFTINVMENTGGEFENAANEKVTVNFVSSFGAENQTSAMCTTDGNGNCTVMINSAMTGQIVASAASNVNVTGTIIPVSTDGIDPNSGNATKVYVDAKITIGPNATNIVGEAHNFTINVMKDAGDGSGFVAVDNQLVNVTYSSTITTPDDSCLTDSNGDCIVTVNSLVNGTIIATATSEIEVGGINVTRTTDGTGNNSYPAQKDYITLSFDFETDSSPNGIVEMPFNITEVTDTIKITGVENYTGNFNVTIANLVNDSDQEIVGSLENGQVTCDGPTSTDTFPLELVCTWNGEALDPASYCWDIEVTDISGFYDPSSIRHNACEFTGPEPEDDDREQFTLITQGCTPGYWKQSQHFGSWNATGLSPIDPYDTLEDAGFIPMNGVSNSTTLLEALEFDGGSTLEEAEQILLRAAVAALLNELHPDVEYALTDVVAEANEAMASMNRDTMLQWATTFDDWNNPPEGMDDDYDFCPLGRAPLNDSSEGPGNSRGNGPPENPGNSFNKIRFHSVNPVSSDSTTSDNVSKDGKKGSSNEHLTRPTFGISHETNVLLVTDGFSFNDKPFTMSDNHHTPFDEQTISIGEENSFSAKVYAPKGIKVQEFLFGVPIIGQGHLAELGVEVWFDHQGEIIDVKAVQQSKVIDKETLTAVHEKAQCMPSDKNKNCDLTTISMVFYESLKDNVMAVKAIDHKNRYQLTYLNDGFEIAGDSLNPSETLLISSNVKGEGLIEVTQTSKYSPYWISGDGRMFEMNSFGSFKEINSSFERFQDTGDAKTRMHSGFAGIIEYEQNKASKLFDSSEFVSELPSSFAYVFPQPHDRMTDELKEQMLLQEELAKKILSESKVQARW